MNRIIKCCFFAALTLLPCIVSAAGTAEPEKAEPSREAFFSNFASARRYFFENVDKPFLKQFETARTAAGKPVVLDDDLSFDWMLSRVDFLYYTLGCNMLFWGFHGKQKLLLEEHYKWWHSNVGSSQNNFVVSNESLMLDAQRLATRYGVNSLLIKNGERYFDCYKVLANQGGINVAGEGAPVKFDHGEAVVVKKQSPSRGIYTFYAELIPETCVKLPAGYAGCLRTFENIFTRTPAQYYFAIWDADGKQLALQQLDIPVRNKLPIELDAEQKFLHRNNADGVFGERLDMRIVDNDVASITLYGFTLAPEDEVWRGEIPLSLRNNNAITQPGIVIHGEL